MINTKSRTSQLLRGAMVVPLVAGAVTIAATGTASASACTHPPWSDKDKTGYGYGTVSAGTTVRTGPNSQCPMTSIVGTNVVLYYHCYVVNSAGNTWTNVGIGGSPEIDGWVWDAELNNDGSVYQC